MGVGVGSPRADRSGTTTLAPARQGGDDHRECGEFLGGGLTPNDTKQRLLTHNGMFPCFLPGRVWRLLASTRSALVTCTRVCDGGMTAST